MTRQTYVELHANTKFHDNTFSARVTPRVQTDGQTEMLTGDSQLGRYSAFGIVTRLGLQAPGFEFRWVQNIFLFTRSPARPTQPPIKCVPGKFLGGKAAGA
jgi:hypothetical protein